MLVVFIYNIYNNNHMWHATVSHPRIVNIFIFVEGNVGEMPKGIWPCVAYVYIVGVAIYLVHIPIWQIQSHNEVAFSISAMPRHR